MKFIKNIVSKLFRNKEKEVEEVEECDLSEGIKINIDDLVIVRDSDERLFLGRIKFYSEDEVIIEQKKIIVFDTKDISIDRMGE